ncbi:DJ-1/PfpI family protein [Bradyrhizobium jicamae]|uniref:DJ-1/PfpI family protein n=1 Tax=Bradyrhizobium jicamae TaxID=280332 RepID=A0ABS5FWS6_9BRAD|nr:DJ-1/PfpI family protein [Bradyrhizobium jicamae]MBR0801303.1 DJ-1/PfpI family protein [Bradyrhizobium jicamae]MBR0931741.1 DJ-1/PfpI family protein [Bradyrhizobium jicamae]
MKVLALAFPGFTFIDLAGPMQAFMMLPGFSSQVVWQTRGIVDSDAGVSVQATEDFGSCWKDPDILFVPGNTVALFKLLQDDRTLDFIADVGSRAKWITSVCNGSLLLGAAGLLKGYKAASYWYTRDHLGLFGAIPTDARYVIDGNRATGGGMTAGVDFGLAMVGEIAGEHVGRVAELSFEYAPRPPFGTGRPELADPATLAHTTEILKQLMPVQDLESVRARRLAMGRL